ncbi:MAG: hypothetical protein JO286_10680 [Solirubrobacterales bacterium]|nr:hypothetical protein [Solirubrobacterales bacterium]MBV9807639.1 hypothetical protein [Solirubrobacterales bacterium]
MNDQHYRRHVHPRVRALPGATAHPAAEAWQSERTPAGAVALLSTHDQILNGRSGSSSQAAASPPIPPMPPSSRTVSAAPATCVQS